MTPAEHRTEAEAGITELSSPRTGYQLTPFDFEWIAVEAHAHLAQALGTGAHYAEADALLAMFAERRTLSSATSTEHDETTRRALTHAVLADR